MGTCIRHRNFLFLCTVEALSVAFVFQVVVPHMTQCYSDSMDPPEESIPLCTLRHFPHAIEHTIEWSRDAFQGLFTDKIADDSQFAKDPKAFITNVNSGAVPSSKNR